MQDPHDINQPVRTVGGVPLPGTELQKEPTEIPVVLFVSTPDPLDQIDAE